MPLANDGARHEHDTGAEVKAEAEAEAEAEEEAVADAEADDDTGSGAGECLDAGSVVSSSIFGCADDIDDGVSQPRLDDQCKDDRLKRRNRKGRRRSITDLEDLPAFEEEEEKEKGVEGETMSTAIANGGTPPLPPVPPRISGNGERSASISSSLPPQIQLLMSPSMVTQPPMYNTPIQRGENDKEKGIETKTAAEGLTAEAGDKSEQGGFDETKNFGAFIEEIKTGVMGDAGEVSGLTHLISRCLSSCSRGVGERRWLTMANPPAPHIRRRRGSFHSTNTQHIHTYTALDRFPITFWLPLLDFHRPIPSSIVV